MKKKKLNPKKIGREAEELLEFLKSRVLFQNRAIESIVRAIEYGKSPLKHKHRPISSFLFLGPSGVVKTETARALAEYEFGNPRGFLLINGSEFSERHTVSKLIGSPPGYIGYDEKPMLSQENIEKYILKTTEEIAKKDSRMRKLDKELTEVKRFLKERLEEDSISKKEISELKERIASIMNKRQLLSGLLIQDYGIKLISIILFDELEKAHPLVWNILLQILDEGIVDLRNGDRSHFNNSILIMTSNIGSLEMAKFSRGVQHIGFSQENEHQKDEIYRVAIAKARKTLPPELMSRITRVEVFRPLDKDKLREITRKKITKFQQEITLSEFPIELIANQQIVEYILNKSSDHPEEGARLIDKNIRRYLIDPINNLIASKQIKIGDRIFVDIDKNDKKSFLVFFKDTDVKLSKIDIDKIKRKHNKTQSDDNNY